MLLKLFGFAIFFALLNEIKCHQEAADAGRKSHRRSRSNVAHFNSKIQQIEIPSLFANNNGNEIQTQSNGFYDLLDIGDQQLQWTEWSFCSQSCGGGVTMRSQICADRMQLDGSDVCGNVQYKTCNTEPCPGPYGIDFRSYQCSQYNHRPVFPSARFRWTPYHGSNVASCHLTCKASGFDLYKTFGLVQDGTRCWKDKTDVCIDGKCMKVGCDQIVGSNLTHDACGICGGDNTGCFHFTSNYSQAPSTAVRFNYYEIAMIPSGATQIKIEEESENILALMEAEGKFVKYVMNGNWIMRRPGSFTAAGTSFKYSNKNNRDIEVIEGKGPTTMDLHIMMIYLEERPLVKYEYWIPTKQIEKNFHNNFDMEDPPAAVRLENNGDRRAIEEFSQEVNASSRAASFAATTSSLDRPPISAQHETNTTDIRHRQKSKKRRLSSHCQSCEKPRNRRKHFCSSDFVIRARISSKTKMKGKRYRHDLKIIAVYKSNFALMGREFLWIYNGCCPKLRPGREYIIMGQKDKIRMGKRRKDRRKSLRSGNDEDGRFETRLLLNHTHYWHPWKQKYSTGMNRLSNKLKCKNKKRVARTSKNVFQ